MAVNDPFSVNLLKQVLQPKIVSDGNGGFITKVDLVNVDNITATGQITGSGAIGELGPTGPAGSTGPAGAAGAAGAAGSAGSAGATGSDGATGPAGANGIDGAIGPTGDAGPVGAPSDVTGPTGERGPTGADGPGLPNGGPPGEFLYWDGSAWVAAGADSIAIGPNPPSVRGTNSIYIGLSSGGTAQTNTVAIGTQSGQAGLGPNAIAIGNLAGKSQNVNAIAIGWAAGSFSQGTGSIAIGGGAAPTQADDSIAIGNGAAMSGSQGPQAVAIGAGSQALGSGAYAIGIGSYAGIPVSGKGPQDGQSIVINASGNYLPSAGGGSLVIRPIRNAIAANNLYYNPSSGEVTYSVVSPADQTVVGYAVDEGSQYFLYFVTFYSDNAAPANTFSTNVYTGEDPGSVYVSSLVNNGLYYLASVVLVGQLRTDMWVSANGINWQLLSTIPSSNITSLAWNSYYSYWVATSSPTVTFGSQNGKVWQTLTGLVGTTPYSILNSNSPSAPVNKNVMYVGGNNAGDTLAYVQTTGDGGGSWASHPQANTANCYVSALALDGYGGNGAVWNPTIVACIASDTLQVSNANPAITYSIDEGATWAIATGGPPLINTAKMVGVAYNGFTWIAVGTSWGTGLTQMWSSPDGKAWTEIVGFTVTKADDIKSISWNGYAFIVTCLYSTGISTDGTTWVFNSLYQTSPAYPVTKNSVSCTKSALWGTRLS